MPEVPTGIPGTKRAVGGASIERVVYEAETAAAVVVDEHELSPDPHPQYTNEDIGGPAGLMPMDGAPGEDGMMGQAGPAGPTGATGAQGPPGSGEGGGGIGGMGPPGLDAEVEEPLFIPGPAGAIGPTGPTGPPGSGGSGSGTTVIWQEDVYELDEPVVIPGPVGVPGNPGAAGADGSAGVDGADGNLMSYPAGIAVFVQEATPTSPTPQRGDLWIKVLSGEDAV